MSLEQICGSPEASEPCGTPRIEIWTYSAYSATFALVAVLNQMVFWCVDEATMQSSRLPLGERSLGR